MDELNENLISGVIVVDKPVGMTSHDVVQVVRNGTNIRRVGHTGTLDPRASGVLVLLLGPAVRLSEYISASDKRYQAVIQLGRTTDTFDGEGRTIQSKPVDVSKEQFLGALQDYIGEIQQVPPPYSAIKVGGRKAYNMARAGEEVELEPRKIIIYSADLLEWQPPEAIIDVYCSSGTYIRCMANDLGRDLGCGGFLSGLRRIKSGRFTLRDAVSLKKLQEAFTSGDWTKYVIPAAEALADWPSVPLTEQQVADIRHGHRIPAETGVGKMARGLGPTGELIALLELDAAAGQWQPKKVF